MNALERWRKAVLTLADPKFFDIVRNYLGEVKTPFNKHSLVERLEAWMRAPETRRRIVALITDTEARVLTALDLLGGAAITLLADLFKGDLPYFRLHQILLNLDDRLIVYTDRSTETETILLSPFLEEEIRHRVVSLDLLFPSSANRESGGESWLSEGLVLALLSSILAGPEMLKSDGSLKKKAVDSLGEAFPVLAVGGQARMEGLLGGLLSAGLLYLENGTLKADLSAWRVLADYDQGARQLFLWTSAVEPDPDKARRLASFLPTLCASMPPDRCFEPAVVARMASTLAAASGFDPDLIDIRGVLRLVDIAVFFDNGNGLVYHPGRPPTKPPEHRPIVLLPTGELTARPDLSIPAGLVIAAATVLRRFDTVAHYEFSRDAYTRARSLGLAPEELRSRLEQLSASPLPQNLAFQLDHWEREFRSLSVYRGLVVVVDAEHRHAFDHRPDFEALVRRRLAPGVYLLDSGMEKDLQAFLQRAGLPPTPGITEPAAAGREGGRVPRLTVPAAAADLFALTWDGRRPEDRKKAADTIIGELENELESRSLTEDRRTEVRERIDRRVILFPNQLDFDSGRKEKTEARGIDYSGKVRLIEQVLANQAEVLEIVVREKNGEPRRLLVRPTALAKAGTDLVLEARSLETSVEVSIRVGKLALVRRVRGSFSG